MPIRIPFPVEEPPSVELSSYPLAELALSLHTVADPKRPVRYAAFARRMRARLPRTVASELDALAPLLGPPAPAPFAYPEDHPGDAVSALAEVSPSDEDFQWSLSMHLELKPSAAPVMQELARDPAAVAERFLQLLRDYWEHAFEREWVTVEAKLAIARAEAELALERGGVGALLDVTTARARLSPAGITITPTIPVDTEVALQEDGVLPVVISLFSAPWVITRVAPAAGLVLPAPHTDVAVRSPSLSLVQELDAIADPTRLTILRLVGDRPRSTRELSELLGLSEAGVSKHLRRLAEAGLVDGERRGYYVLYKLRPERAAAASQGLLEFLRVASDSPAG
jgi:DNA-binding transcriptional ArsR family regulator